MDDAAPRNTQEFDTTFSGGLSTDRDRPRNNMMQKSVEHPKREKGGKKAKNISPQASVSKLAQKDQQNLEKLKRKLDKELQDAQLEMLEEKELQVKKFKADVRKQLDITKAELEAEKLSELKSLEAQFAGELASEKRIAESKQKTALNELKLRLQKEEEEADRQMRQELQQRLRQLQEKLNELNAQKERSLEDQIAAAKRDLKTRTETELQTAEREHRQQLDQAIDKIRAEKAQLLEENIRKIEEDHKEKLSKARSELKSKYDRETQALDRELAELHSIDMERKRSEIKAAQQCEKIVKDVETDCKMMLAERKQQLQRDHEHEIAAVKADHEATIERIKSEYQSKLIDAKLNLDRVYDQELAELTRDKSEMIDKMKTGILKDKFHTTEMDARNDLDLQRALDQVELRKQELARAKSRLDREALDLKEQERQQATLTDELSEQRTALMKMEAELSKKRNKLRQEARAYDHQLDNIHEYCDILPKQSRKHVDATNMNSLPSTDPDAESATHSDSHPPTVLETARTAKGVNESSQNGLNSTVDSTTTRELGDKSHRSIASRPEKPSKIPHGINRLNIFDLDSGEDVSDGDDDSDGIDDLEIERLSLDPTSRRRKELHRRLFAANRRRVDALLANRNGQSRGNNTAWLRRFIRSQLQTNGDRVALDENLNISQPVVGGSRRQRNGAHRKMQGAMSVDDLLAASNYGGGALLPLDVDDDEIDFLSADGSVDDEAKLTITDLDVHNFKRAVIERNRLQQQQLQQQGVADMAGLRAPLATSSVLNDSTATVGRMDPKMLLYQQYLPQYQQMMMSQQLPAHRGGGRLNGGQTIDQHLASRWMKLMTPTVPNYHTYSIPSVFGSSTHGASIPALPGNFAARSLFPTSSFANYSLKYPMTSFLSGSDLTNRYSAGVDVTTNNNALSRGNVIIDEMKSSRSTGSQTDRGEGQHTIDNTFSDM